ncbi:MAG: hypothetical protein Q9199_003918 [Rusavskia elegans]
MRLQDQARSPHDGREEVLIAASLPVAYDFRSRFLYNNNILGVVGHVIQEASGRSSGTFLRERIFEPLGLLRTSTSNRETPTDGNVATGYLVLDDGSLVTWDQSALEDGQPQCTADYVRSTVRDMLTWAKAVKEAESDGQPSSFNRGVNGNGSRASEQVLRQVAYIRTTKRPMIDEKSPLENSYALGWFRHMLPSSWLGSIGPNFGLFAEPPLINASGCPRLTIAHWGEFNGFLTAFYTFPGTKSAVVVMANCSPGRGDPTDLVAQHLVQDLFDMQPRVDFQQAAYEAASTAKLMWPALVEEFVTKRVQNTKHRPLQDYVGIYQSTYYKVTIDIYELPKAKAGKGPNPELLGFKINSLPRQAAKLRHYHYDSWTFIPDSRDDGMGPPGWKM